MLAWAGLTQAICLSCCLLSAHYMLLQIHAGKCRPIAHFDWLAWDLWGRERTLCQGWITAACLAAFCPLCHS